MIAYRQTIGSFQIKCNATNNWTRLLLQQQQSIASAVKKPTTNLHVTVFVLKRGLILSNLLHMSTARLVAGIAFPLAMLLLIINIHGMKYNEMKTRFLLSMYEDRGLTGASTVSCTRTAEKFHSIPTRWTKLKVHKVVVPH